MIFSIKRFNKTLRTGNFSDKLKLADITPVFKKSNPFKKGKRSTIVLPVVTKIYWILISTDSYFSTQQALISLTEKWTKIWIKKGMEVRY